MGEGPRSSTPVQRYLFGVAQQLSGKLIGFLKCTFCIFESALSFEM